MRKKNRNNALRMKRSLQKTLQKTGEALKATEKRRLEAQKLKEEQKRELLEKERKQTILVSLTKMSYNELRKIASDVGIIIYQRKKEQIRKDLKDYYEQLWAETH
tara:strand:+ start:241 stop:555 length:315 start_codon:yes stop_codon:yes gene_type:complete